MKGCLGCSGLLRFFCNVPWGSNLKAPSSSLSVDRYEEALIQRHLTEEPDRRTAPFQPHPQSMEHTGQYTGLKIFCTAHNLLHFLIAKSFPSAFPCLCLTPRYSHDLFWLYVQISIPLIPQLLPISSITALQELELLVVTLWQALLPPLIPTIKASFLHRKLVSKLLAETQFYWLEKWKFHWGKLDGKIIKC